jgi:hypothetical protein
MGCAVEQNRVHRTSVESGLAPLECQSIERFEQASGIEVLRDQRKDEVPSGEPACFTSGMQRHRQSIGCRETVGALPPQGIARRLASQR